jgi:sugar lactone lactonase YvrE/thiol-disulfide isomerase/thioredoxin
VKHFLKATTFLLIACSLAMLCSCSVAPSAPTPAAATITGFVFRDLNANGTRDAREQGEAGIIVLAYDAENNLVASTTTDVSGDYVLNAGLDRAKIIKDEDYRIEFSGWPEHLAPGPQGRDSGTEMQFVVGGATDVGFGVLNPDQYVSVKPTTGGLQAEEQVGPDSAPAASSTAPPTPTEETSKAETTSPYDSTIPAPSFPIGLDWLNTSRTLTFADLRGKVVLLEFWTYGCINCIQTIPQLKMLEEKYADELVIIGVHAAKFPHEAQTENIRHIIQRYELEHPVINDKDYAVAKLYGAHIWPTFEFISPTGEYLGGHAGVMSYNQLNRIIGEIIEEFDARGLIDRTPLALTLEMDSVADSPLRFPSAVLADEANNRLFIVDSNHNRIVITDLSGNVQDVIGNGQSAWRDGDYETASFYHPQGITLADDDTLYVADTENQTIRRVDLAARTVETVAGVGERILIDADSGPALKSRLNSPWDVLYVDGLIYVAMAGQHQLWIYDPAAGQVKPFAGTGIEELRDGSLLSAGLNQPSALTTDGRVIYFADSEASAIRQADIDPAGTVSTIVGLGFYEFGDIDGIGDEVRLQRPVGIAYQDGMLYVADTYNNKIKTINPETREALTFLGSGESGWKDGVEALFDEPSGLSVTTDKLYIADTNNHVIRVADLTTEAVSTLVLVDSEGLLNTNTGATK